MTPACSELIAFIRARLEELERPARIMAEQHERMRAQGYAAPWPRPAVCKAFEGSRDAAGAEAALALIEAHDPEPTCAWRTTDDRHTAPVRPCVVSHKRPIARGASPRVGERAVRRDSAS